MGSLDQVRARLGVVRPKPRTCDLCCDPMEDWEDGSVCCACEGQTCFNCGAIYHRQPSARADYAENMRNIIGADPLKRYAAEAFFKSTAHEGFCHECVDAYNYRSDSPALKRKP